MTFPDDDEFPTLFQPDVILPTQGTPPSRGAHATAYAGHARTPAEPELALVARVVEQGVDDFKNCGPRGTWRAGPGSERNVTHLKEATAAELWLASQENHPFSFQWCCDILGLESDDVRRALSITARPAATRTETPFPRVRAKSTGHNSPKQRKGHFRRELGHRVSTQDSHLAQAIAALVHSREPESPTRS